MPSIPAHRRWTIQLVVLCAVATVAVSTIYLPQAMLTNIARDLGVAPSVASFVATAVQVGYAAGIFLLVPLSDRIQPRRQITVQLVLLAVALLATSILPDIVGVIIGFLVVGIVANIAQLTIPAANRLAPEGRSGATTTALVGSLLIGIFGGRVVASLLVDALGWRLVVVVFAALVLLAIPFLRRALRTDVALSGLGKSYGSLLLSTIKLTTQSAPLLYSVGMNFFAFATFNSLWTVMVLHLTGPQFGWSVAQAGLFGLVGLAAGAATPFAGRFVDRFGAVKVAGVSLAVMLAGVVSVAIDANQIILFGISMFVLTLANQTGQSANQNRVMRANLQAPAQANTMFMVGVFLGGSLGALLGPVAFGLGGMTLVGVQAIVLVAISLLVWVLAARAARRA
ncbi:MFS transporter [Subtercola boreus]|uniref:MFS transporter n=1 Tax=Subtercola boreus TaxID=120213 RepID=A0A3E0VLR3_9MICO|nr:MFS transporter [Subtercola boreus]RFA10595.1 MFS transporter [Subtercola boreus]TQL55857.1 putative MFS family arabinose efflux permease [Subtercola boreus]